MPENRLLVPEEWNRCDIQLFRLRQGPPKLGSIECNSNDQIAWRIEAGEVEVKTSKATFHARQGQWLFLANGYRRQDFSADAQLTSLAFWAYWPNSLRPILDLRPGLRVEHSERLDQCLTALRERPADEVEYEWHYQHDRMNFETALTMDSWFRHWLAEAITLWRHHLPGLETSQEEEPRVEITRQWLNRQPLDLALPDLQEVAETVGMSVGHLNRLFLHHYHLTMHGYHEQRRLQHARRALLEPGARIKEVALELGFIELSRFSAWFRRLEQTAPRTYQKRFRAEG